MSVVIFCDGLCEPRNPGGTATYGWVAYKDGQKIAEECAVVCSGPTATNNVAEYSAVIAALEWLANNNHHQETIKVKSDSQLCIYQLDGSYAVRSPRITPLYKKAKQLSKQFRKASFHWIPRERNEEADTLSRKAYAESRRGEGEIGTRKQKAADIVNNVNYIGQERYHVKSQTSDSIYIVDMVVPKCTCPDYVKRQQKTGGKCKHILAVEMAVREKAVS